MYDYRRALLAPMLALTISGLASGIAMAGEAPSAESAAVAATDSAEGVAYDAADEGGPTALSSADRLSYTTAFDALRRGDLDLARASARQANDRVLLGQVEFERLFHPDHVATYEELSAWLDDYSDLPCAQRVYALALKRRPDGAAEPKRPAGVSGRTWSSVVEAGGGSTEDDPAKAARVAYNHDDLSTAYTLGIQIGDWWTTGLAAYRLGQFNDSMQAFERVAADPTEDPWVRAGAGVWAAKAAAQSGRQDRITGFLNLAARWPATFYGQVAMRQLGRDVAIEGLGPRPYSPGNVQQVSYQPALAAGDVNPHELNAFVQSDDRARRTVAYLEVGRRSDAQDELRAGLRTAVGDTARRMWTSLADALGPRMGGSGPDVTRVDATRYATPVLAPQGGFTIEPALVYALARKETDFNAEARSAAGAYGLMQVMPGTAAEMTGDRTFVSRPQQLFDPAVNMRLGQVYVNQMLSRPEFQGDILRAVASYNAGPGPMLAALRKLGPNPDPLLLIETIDVPQARDYVEKVVAAYWIYQRMFNHPLNTLDAVASGAGLVSIGLDYVPPATAPVEMASAPAPSGGL
jgi:soluble lytic murein transglycosylase